MCKNVGKHGRKKNWFMVLRKDDKMQLFKKRNRTRADTRNLAYVISGGDDIIPGYQPLSRNEEIIKCANIIAGLVSSMTIMLMSNEENGDVRVKNELAKKIDVYPCNYMDRKNFIFYLVKDMLINGNAVALVDIDNTGYITNMDPIDSTQCSFIWDDKKKNYFVQYRGKQLWSDELLHFVLNPKKDKPYEGEGYRPAIIDTVKNLAQENATKKGFLQSKWKPSLIISIQADAEELQDPELRKKILGSYTDTTEEGEPWLIPAGEIDVKTVQPLTLNDLAIQDGITLDKKAIAAAFGIPDFMVGIGTFNKDAYNNFITTKIMEIAQIVQQQLSNKLLYIPCLYFKMNQKSLMQYNLSEHMSFVKEMVGGGMMNRNEGRTEFDLSPVDKAGMNDYVVLENYIPVEKVGDQKKLQGGEKEDGSGNKTD